MHKYIESSIIVSGKPLVFVGSALRDIERLPEVARIRIAAEFDRLRLGNDPLHWKPMSSVGPGVREIRVSVGRAFRAIYVASLPKAVFVLHVFEKKSQQTTRRDIELARVRFNRVRTAQELR